MQMLLDEPALAQARRFNRMLAWLPRFKNRHRFTPMLIQALLRLAQMRPASALRAHGIVVQQAWADADGLRVPLRILRPPGPVRGVVLDIHGGGWVIGNAQMNDELNAATAARCRVAVVSIDYRLFGKVPLDAVMADCAAACRWVLEGGLPEYADLPVFIVGESAGAHLAATVLLALQAHPVLLARIHGAVLYYGVYDLAGTPSVHQAGADTLVLDGPGMATALALLTPGLTAEQRRCAPLSPLYGQLHGFPDALMVVGELDPLLDDTVLMAGRWGLVAKVDLQVQPGAPHGFIRFPTRMASATTARAHGWINARLDVLAGRA